MIILLQSLGLEFTLIILILDLIIWVTILVDLTNQDVIAVLELLSTNLMALLISLTPFKVLLWLLKRGPILHNYLCVTLIQERLAQVDTLMKILQTIKQPAHSLLSLNLVLH